MATRRTPLPRRGTTFYVAASPDGHRLAARSLGGRVVSVVDRPLEDDVTGLLRSVDEVRCASEDLAAEVRRRAPTALVRVQPPDVDPTFFRPVPAGGPPDSLVCTAPLHWTAGHEYALLAIRRLHERGLRARLDLVADGPDRQRVQFTLHDLGLAQHVDVARNVTYNELPSRLARCRVYVLAGLEDRPWPELLEAAACGLPIVASDLPWVRKTVSAELVPRRDADALARALEKVLRS